MEVQNGSTTEDAGEITGAIGNGCLPAECLAPTARQPYDAEAFFGAEVTPVPEPVTIGLIAARDARSE